MKRALFGVIVGASLVAATPAWAENQVIHGNDQLVWDKPNVSILPGEKVTWTFDGTTQAHHVKGDGADVADTAWTSFNSPLGVPAAAAEFTFATSGTYKFLCTV